MKPTDEATTLGPCCLCAAEGATVLVMLAARSPIQDRGWSCVTCGLSANGAMAVLCASCARFYEKTGRSSIELDLKWACRGFPGSDGRIPFDELRGEYQHVRRRHLELGDVPALTVLPTDTRWRTSLEEGRGCFCSRCGQTIFAGSGAIRAWTEDGQYEWRYHGCCFGAEPSEWEDPYEEET